MSGEGLRKFTFGHAQPASLCADLLSRDKPPYDFSTDAADTPAVDSRGVIRMTLGMRMNETLTSVSAACAERQSAAELRRSLGERQSDGREGSDGRDITGPTGINQIPYFDQLQLRCDYLRLLVQLPDAEQPH